MNASDLLFASSAAATFKPSEGSALAKPERSDFRDALAKANDPAERRTKTKAGSGGSTSELKSDVESNRDSTSESKVGSKSEPKPESKAEPSAESEATAKSDSKEKKSHSVDSKEPADHRMEAQDHAVASESQSKSQAQGEWPGKVDQDLSLIQVQEGLAVRPEGGGTLLEAVSTVDAVTQRADRTLRAPLPLPGQHGMPMGMMEMEAEATPLTEEMQLLALGLGVGLDVGMNAASFVGPLESADEAARLAALAIGLAPALDASVVAASGTMGQIGQAGRPVSQRAGQEAASLVSPTLSMGEGGSQMAMAASDVLLEGSSETWSGISPETSSGTLSDTASQTSGSSSLSAALPAWSASSGIDVSALAGLSGTASAAAGAAPGADPEAEVDALNGARLTRGLNTAVKQQGGAITLRLTPVEMGTVRIQLQIQGASVSAEFHAETDVARDLLTRQLGQLKNVLERQGLSVDRLSVQSLHGGGAANHAGMQSQTQSDAQNQGSQNTESGESADHAQGDRDASNGQSRGRFGQSQREPEQNTASRERTQGRFRSHLSDSGS